MDKKNDLLHRIVVDPNIMVGKPTVRGTRLTVQNILGLLGRGVTFEKLLQEYPRLTQEDIFACLLFAEQSLMDITFAPMFK